MDRFAGTPSPRRQQVSIATEDDGDVVLAKQRALVKINRECHVNALLTWRVVRPAPVAQVSTDDADAGIAPPSRRLGVVRGCGRGVMGGIGPSPEDPNRGDELSALRFAATRSAIKTG